MLLLHYFRILEVYNNYGVESVMKICALQLLPAYAIVTFIQLLIVQELL